MHSFFLKNQVTCQSMTTFTLHLIRAFSVSFMFQQTSSESKMNSVFSIKRTQICCCCQLHAVFCTTLLCLPSGVCVRLSGRAELITADRLGDIHQTGVTPPHCVSCRTWRGADARSNTHRSLRRAGRSQGWLQLPVGRVYLFTRSFRIESH